MRQTWQAIGKTLAAVSLSWIVGVSIWVVLFGTLYLACKTFAPDLLPIPQPDQPLRVPDSSLLLTATLLIDIVTAFFLGYLLVRWAPNRPLAHLLVVGPLYVLALMTTAVSEYGILPLWVSWGRVVSFPAAFALGGWLMLRQQDQAGIESDFPRRLVANSPAKDVS